VAETSETAINAAAGTLAGEAIPAPKRDMALFLDFDGTLVDIAIAPDAVLVPPDLAGDLAAARDRLGGALAIVSGRPLADLDRFLGPARLVFVGEHGAIHRTPGERASLEASFWPAEWGSVLERFAAEHPSVVVERKVSGVTLHYRLAPEQSADVRNLADALISGNPNYAVFPAKMAWEIRRRDIGKSSAVKALMQQPPFAGRIPVFIGDDVADEAAIAAVSRMGGFGLHTAHAFGGRTAHVRAWLKSFAALDAGDAS